MLGLPFVCVHVCSTSVEGDGGQALGEMVTGDDSPGQTIIFRVNTCARSSPG